MPTWTSANALLTMTSPPSADTQIQGAMTQVSSDAMLTLKGGIVMVN
jgi:hypothetical protein